MKTQRNIQNPEKWVGKYVKHMANWWDFAWGDKGYFVCEWTGKLFRVEDEAVLGFEEYELLVEQKELYNPCYIYSNEGLMKMVQYAEKH